MRMYRWHHAIIVLAVVLPLVLTALACTIGGRDRVPTQPPLPQLTPAPAAPPAAPSDLGAATISDTQINVEWKDNADNELGFRIYRAEGTGDFVLAARLPADTTSHQDQGLKCNTQYRYRVTAANQAGESTPSNTVEAYAGMCP